MNGREIVFGRHVHATRPLDDIVRGNELAGVRDMDLHVVRGRTHCPEDQLRRRMTFPTVHPQTASSAVARERERR